VTFLIVNFININNKTFYNSEIKCEIDIKYHIMLSLFIISRKTQTTTCIICAAVSK